MLKQTLVLSIILMATQLTAQKTVTKLPGEMWWGGHIARAAEMPFEKGYKADLDEDYNGQVQTLLLSNKGRYIYSETPFSFSVEDYDIILAGDDGYVIGTSGKTLASAYAYAATNFMVFSNQKLDNSVTLPQYNLAVQLGDNPSQSSILSFANQIIADSLPAGILLFSSDWQESQGSFSFDLKNFPDPEKMLTQLDELGFKVVLEVSAFISPDSKTFRKLVSRDYAFLADALNPEEVKIVKWKNGYSAVLDLTNPSSKVWLEKRLKDLQKKGIAGFSFAGGSMEEYQDVISEGGTDPYELSEAYSSIGLKSKMSFYGPGYKMGGYPLVRKLPTQDLTWFNLNKVLSSVTLQGLMGYPYGQLDLVSDKEELGESQQELIVRAAQLQAFMPSMSALNIPISSLRGKYLDAYNETLRVRENISPTLKKLISKAGRSGTPVIQSMEFAFPDKGYVDIKDQFMIGDEYLVAPILEEGQKKRTVTFPEGVWLSPDGRGYGGPMTQEFKVSLDRPLYFQSVTIDTKS